MNSCIKGTPLLSVFTLSPVMDEILLWLFFYSSAKWGGMVYPYILSQKQLKMSCWAAHWAAILEFLHKQLTFWAAPLNNNEMIIITQHWVILNELVWTWMNLFEPVWTCLILFFFAIYLLLFSLYLLLLLKLLSVIFYYYLLLSIIISILSLYYLYQTESNRFKQVHSGSNKIIQDYHSLPQN